MTFAARRDIAPGEEVTDDYALLSADLAFRMECRCGSAACRGLVTNDDWRRLDLQERYAGHFSPFLNRRIAAMKSGDRKNPLRVISKLLDHHFLWKKV